MNKDDCIFCKIASKRIPVTLSENRSAVMFMDAHPIAPVHYIIATKDHFDDLIDLLSYGNPTEVMGDVYSLIHDFVWENKVSFDFDLPETGFRIVTNVGKNAGQTVKHLHLHLLGGALLKNDFGA